MNETDPYRYLDEDEDGCRIANDSWQSDWISLLYMNLSADLRDEPDAFVDGMRPWFPVESNPNIRDTPDVSVVFGRPWLDRDAYRQWRENGVPVTVAFDVFTRSCRPSTMERKFRFYDRHGVEEYYVCDVLAERVAG